MPAKISGSLFSSKPMKIFSTCPLRFTESTVGRKPTPRSLPSLESSSKISE